MYRKVKYAISISVITVIILTVIFILVSLDRLDYEYYGLNYNLITANFSQKNVKQPGLHLIGFSNVLLEVPKIFQQLSFPKLQTYTSDYFPLTLSAQVSYIAVAPQNTNGTEKFDFLENYYILFGSLDEQKQILEPIIKNQIIKLASSYSSSDFRTKSDLAETLESSIKQSLKEIISIWTDLEFSVLISSLVCEGISFNIQPYQRQISSLIAHSQRVQSQKVEMTEFIDSVLSKTVLQMQIIQQIIKNSIASTQTLNTMADSSIMDILLIADQTYKNLSFTSSELNLRPELYLVNTNNTV